MTILYFIRHAESVANARNLLAGRVDFPLSETGKSDAFALAREFSETERIDVIWTSPLLRAQQTAAPFVLACNAPLRVDERLQEQHLGRFSGLDYATAEADPAYCRDRSARWDWTPDGGGESYRAIAERVQSFLTDLRAICQREKPERILLVTHAVTLRLFRAVLENTLPRYPEVIAGNGEVWRTTLTEPGIAVAIETLQLRQGTRQHRA